MSIDELREGFAGARRRALRDQGVVPFEKVRRNQLTMVPASRLVSTPSRAGITQLGKFASNAGLMLDSAFVSRIFEKCPMRGGLGHRIAYLEDSGRVIKDVDLHSVQSQSAFACLTDTLLSNYYFGDDLQVVGFYEEGASLHMLITQPYIDGKHPENRPLKLGLCSQGLFDPALALDNGSAVIEDPREEECGKIAVMLLHRDNVVRDATGWFHPINAHFNFRENKFRAALLQRLGLDRIHFGSLESNPERPPVLDLMSLDWHAVKSPQDDSRPPPGTTAGLAGRCGGNGLKPGAVGPMAEL